MENTFNKIKQLDEVMTYIKDGCSILYGGFGGVGTPPLIIDGILDKGIKNLTLIGNDSSFSYSGVGKLIKENRVKKIITSHIGVNEVTIEKMNNKEIEVELCPQDTLVERIRAGGSGIGGFLTNVGVGTIMEEGKQTMLVGGIKYLLELPILADIAIVHARKADVFGNLLYIKTGRNFCPTVATAGKITIAQAEEIVELGRIEPEEVVTSGIFVNVITPGKKLSIL